MRGQHTRGQCKPSLMTCSTKQSSAMLMIWWSSPRKGWNTYKTFAEFLNDCEDANWKWTYSNVRLASLLKNSRVSLFIIEGLRSTNLRSEQSKKCLNQKILRSFVVFKVAWYIYEDSYQISQDAAVCLATLWRKVHLSNGTSHVVRLLRR